LAGRADDSQGLVVAVPEAIRDKARGAPISEKTWNDFLKALERYGQINAAAVAVGITRKTVHVRMKERPEFAEAVKEHKEHFGGTVRQRTVRMAEEGNLKANVLLEQLANHEDFPKAQAALGGGAPTLVINFHGPQRLDELPVAESFPAIDVTSRVLHDGDE
jgi:hypothetical protein